MCVHPHRSLLLALNLHFPLLPIAFVFCDFQAEEMTELRASSSDVSVGKCYPWRTAEAAAWRAALWTSRRRVYQVGLRRGMPLRSGTSKGIAIHRKIQMSKAMCARVHSSFKSALTVSRSVASVSFAFVSCLRSCVDFL